MMKQKYGREKPIFSRGVLENAGLGEVAFFLKKAKTNILYAAMALENTDFSAMNGVAGLQAKIARLRDFVAEVSGDIDQSEQELVAAVSAREFSGEDEVPEVE